MNKLLIPVILSIIILLGITTVYADEDLIPSWIKIIVEAWTNGTITDNEYMSAMSFLIETNIIPMNLTSSSITNEEKRLYELEIANRDNTILILNSTFSDMVSLEIQVEEWKAKYDDAEARRVLQSQSDAAQHKILYDEADKKLVDADKRYDDMVEKKGIAYREAVQKLEDEKQELKEINDEITYSGFSGVIQSLQNKIQELHDELADK